MGLLYAAASTRRRQSSGPPASDHIPAGAVEWWDFSRAVPQSGGSLSGAVIGRIAGGELVPVDTIPVTTIGANQAIGGGVSGAACLKWAAANIAQPFAVMFVFKGWFDGAVFDSNTATASQSQTRVVSGSYAMQAGGAVTVQPTDGVRHVAWFEFNGAESRAYIDNVLEATGDAGSNPLVGGLTVLNNRNTNVACDTRLGELMVIAGIPTSLDRDATVNGRLNKWADSTPPITPPVAPLSAPRNLLASAASSSAIDLAWNPPLNDGGTAVSSYQVARSLDGSAWSNIATPTATSYTDTGRAASTLYYYRVRAFNGSFGPWSTVVSARTLASGGVGPTGPLIEVSGIHCVLNRSGTYNHAQRFGYYAGEYTSGTDSSPGLGFVPRTVLLATDRNGPGLMAGNTSAARSYWNAWTGSRPKIMDVIIPLGFTNNTRSVAAEMQWVLAGNYDGDYITAFSNLNALARTDMHISLRIGNEANLAHAWPHSMLRLPEADRSLFGLALDHVARIGRNIISNVSIQYNTQHAATEYVSDYVAWAWPAAPAYLHNDTTTRVLNWPLNRGAGTGMTEVDIYSMNLYVGNKSATALVSDLNILNTAGVRDGKKIAVPEWGIKASTISAAGALAGLQTMVDGFMSVPSGDRLMFQQYFEDQTPWMLHLQSNWGGQNLLDNYGAMVLAAT